MKAPGWQNIITSGNFLSIGAMLLAVSGFYFDTRFRLDTMEKFRIERTAQTDRRFDDINKSIAELPQLSYRVTKVESAIEQIIPTALTADSPGGFPIYLKSDSMFSFAGDI